MLADPWTPLEPEIVAAMLDMAALQAGELHLDLGSGDGRFLVAAQTLGATSIGYEIDAGMVATSRSLGLTVKQSDCMNAITDIRKADVITAWFTVEPYATQLIDLLSRTMKRGARLAFLYNSLVEYRDGVRTEKGIPVHVWQPTQTKWVIGNKCLLYVKA